MNTEPFLASTLVPWTVNGPTALPHDDALAEVDPASPSGMMSTTTSSGASTRATPRAMPDQLGPGQLGRRPNRRTNRQLNRRSERHLGCQAGPPGPWSIGGLFHVATGNRPPVPMASGKIAPVPLSGDGAGYGLVAP